MANVGSGASGKTLIGAGNGASPTFASIGTNSGLSAHGVVIAENLGAFGVTAAGTVGQVLQSGGPSADPTYSTATYPSTAGNSGNILTSNGTNWLSSAPTTFSQVIMQTFISNGTYTPTAGMKYCVVECFGGGGGGGGAIGSLTLATAGAGGGGGAYTRGVFSAATIGASQAISIGVGGTGGSNTGGDGGAGGTTSLGSLISAPGGDLGRGSTATPSAAGSNVGGVGGTSGFVANQFTLSGGAGGSSLWTSNFSYAGFGGGGGGGAAKIAAVPNHTPGLSGNFPGGGGGGGCVYLDATGAVGGGGLQGYMVITEYIA